jgi:RNA polymerase sigma-B factor
LVARYARTRDRRLHEEVVRRYSGFARNLAIRYAGRGESTEDLVQVANLGLLAALQRFDPDVGTPFLAFATPTVLGELRRHFRDRVMPMRLPRGLQERVAELEKVIEILVASLGHSPTVKEIAEFMSLDEEDVLEAFEASTSRRVASLDAPVRDDAQGSWDTTGSIQGEIDKGFEFVEDWHAVASAFAELSADERAAIKLRFATGMTQDKIGQRIGCSQMQVSRLLRRGLGKLRAAARDEGPKASGPDSAARDEKPSAPRFAGNAQA